MFWLYTAFEYMNETGGHPAIVIKPGKCDELYRAIGEGKIVMVFELLVFDTCCLSPLPSTFQIPWVPPSFPHEGGHMSLSRVKCPGRRTPCTPPPPPKNKKEDTHQIHQGEESLTTYCLPSV